MGSHQEFVKSLRNHGGEALFPPDSRVLSSAPTLADGQRVRLALLGGFQVRVDQGQPVTFPSGKVQALLAFLALAPGRAHARDKLATLLWEGLGEAEARASLRQAL